MKKNIHQQWRQRSKHERRPQQKKRASQSNYECVVLFISRRGENGEPSAECSGNRCLPYYPAEKDHSDGRLGSYFETFQDLPLIGREKPEELS